MTVSRVLASPPLAYLGRISYGLYLWHLFVPILFYDAARRLGFELSWSLPTLAMAWTATTVALSAFCWHLFEAPINALKRHVPYVVAGSPGARIANLEPVVNLEPETLEPGTLEPGT